MAAVLKYVMTELRHVERTLRGYCFRLRCMCVMHCSPSRNEIKMNKTINKTMYAWQYKNIL
jgi:hypothetical protein